jgi:phospholipid/cholesterol/gamma-HCH transport system substrate-binding protein
MRSPFGFLKTSFLEKNTKLIGFVGISLILAGSVFSLLLSGGVFARTYHVTAIFTDGAGIQPGDAVTVAGLKAGTVKGLKIEHGQVAMDLAVGTSVKLTPDTSANIVVQTLLGKRQVDLVNGLSSGSLHDGSVIPVDRTTTPVDITQLNDISVRLLRGSDAQALNTLLAEVTKVTQGKEGQVRTIITNLNRVLAAVDSRRTQLSGLLDSLNVVATTLGEKDATIVSLIDRLNFVLSNLAGRSKDIATLLQSTDSASHATADLVSQNRRVLDATLNSLHVDLGVLSNHQLDLAASVDYLEQSVQGYSSVGYSAGVPNTWANVFVESLGPAGVDQLIGKCGAVDQLIDQILGTDCSKTGGTGGIPPIPGLPGGGGPVPGGGPSIPPLPIPIPTISLPPLPGLPRLPALPGNIGDLVNSALRGSSSLPAPTGGLP